MALALQVPLLQLEDAEWLVLQVPWAHPGSDQVVAKGQADVLELALLGQG